MKPAVAITLIIGGVIIVALPPLSDAWMMFMVARLLEHGASSVNLNGQMPDLYRFGCWLVGAVMIGVATIASFHPASGSAPSRLVPTME